MIRDQQLSSLTWERLRSSRMREYKQAIWKMRKIRGQLGKREQGRKINSISPYLSLASLWSHIKCAVFCLDAFLSPFTRIQYSRFDLRERRKRPTWRYVFTIEYHAVRLQRNIRPTIDLRRLAERLFSVLSLRQRQAEAAAAAALGNWLARSLAP